MKRMTVTMDDARARVVKGAALLDAEAPGWDQRIDVGLLDLHAPCFCVLGQIYGNYFAVVRRIYSNWPRAELRLSAPQATLHGFRHTGTDGGEDGSPKQKAQHSEYRVLQDAWIELLAARLVTGDDVPTTADVQEATK